MGQRIEPFERDELWRMIERWSFALLGMVDNDDEANRLECRDAFAVLTERILRTAVNMTANEAARRVRESGD